MRIIQLIDSLDVGGAERIAVNYANALSKKIAFSGLVSTRKAGALRSRINQEVFFECLEKRLTFDIKAIFKLRSICKNNQIEYVHAHGTSYFTAFLLKLMHRDIKIIWHEHAGARSEKWTIHNAVLWLISRFFCGIVVVNHELEVWCRTKLAFDQVVYLPNFTSLDGNERKVTVLNGFPDKRIVCLANLRNPKNHALLLKVAVKLKQSQPDWTFHFIGKDLNDDYSLDLKAKIVQENLLEHVFIYDVCEDISNILDQASIGVLSSSSEGLPVALLEYGSHRKAVVVTAVGEMPLVVEHGVSGFTVPPASVDLFYQRLSQLIEDVSLREKFGNALYEKINKSHSEEFVIERYLDWLNHDLKC